MLGNCVVVRIEQFVSQLTFRTNELKKNAPCIFILLASFTFFIKSEKEQKKNNNEHDSNIVL